MARKTSSSRNADTAPTMGRSLKRFLGLIACGGLVAASVWINGQTNAQESVSEQNPFDRYRTGTSSGTTPSKSAKSSDVNRRRVEDEMHKARIALRTGNSKEATRLASLADQMARQWKITFKADEQTPTELLTLIQGPASDEQFAQSETPSGVEQVSAADDPHASVQALLTEAREDIRRGDLDVARQKVDQARDTDVEYGNFDIRPEHVLADLARKQAASPKGPSETFAVVQRPAKPSWTETEAPAPRGAQTIAPQGESDLKAQAQELVALARECLDNGQLEEARALAMEAQKLEVSSGLLDEHPEHVLADIERRTKSVLISGNRKKVIPAASSNEGQATHDEALRLLREAQQSLRSGNLQIAKQKATQAAELDVAYAIFDDRPDLVLQEIREAESRASIAASRPSVNQSVGAND